MCNWQDIAEAPCPFHFHCLHSYCIDIHRLCNGEVDCPDAFDEHRKICHAGVQRSCPGMLRCHGTNVCIPKWEICDGVRHCALGDDEAHCSPCHDGCICAFYTCSCRGVNIHSFDAVSHYRVVAISASPADLWTTSLTQDDCAQLLYMEINKCHLKRFFAENCINLFFLGLSLNDLSIISADTISLPSHLIFLDLSENNISRIEKNVLPRNLEFLNLRDNTIAILDMDLFSIYPVEADLKNNPISAILMNAIPSASHMAIYMDSPELFCIINSPSFLYDENICRLKKPLLHLTVLFSASAIFLSVLLTWRVQVKCIRSQDNYAKFHFASVLVVDTVIVCVIFVGNLPVIIYKSNYHDALYRATSPHLCLAIKTALTLCLNTNLVMDLFHSLLKLVNIKDPFLQLRMKLDSRYKIAIILTLPVVLSVRFVQPRDKGLTFEKELKYPVCLADTISSGKPLLRDVLTLLSSIVGILCMAVRLLTFCRLTLASKQAQKESSRHRKIKVMKQVQILLINGIINIGTVTGLLFILRSFGNHDLALISLQVSAIVIVVNHSVHGVTN